MKKINWKRYLGFFLLANLFPLIGLIEKYFNKHDPCLISSNRYLSGYVEGWICNGAVMLVAAFLFFVTIAVLIDSDN